MTHAARDGVGSEFEGVFEGRVGRQLSGITLLCLGVGACSGGNASLAEPAATTESEAPDPSAQATVQGNQSAASSSATPTDPPGIGNAPATVLDPPPAPPTNGAKPTLSVSSPNLRVLPWAGFSAAVTFTFDDTQPSQAEHWPVLQASGVPMTFFANPSSNWQAGYDATWSAVAAAGSEIGNHTWGHCRSDLSECDAPLANAEAEIDQANDYILSRLGVGQVISFASPFGDSGWKQYAASRFLLGRGVQSGMVPATGASDWHDLPAVAVSEGETQSDFNAAIDGARAQGRWAILLFHTIRPTADDWYAGVEIDDISASLTYGKSLTDVWLDTLGEIGAYARAQQLFEALEPIDDTWSWTLPEHFPRGKLLRVTVDGGKLSQDGVPLEWDPHGYYEVALDAGSLSWSAE